MANPKELLRSPRLATLAATAFLAPLAVGSAAAEASCRTSPDVVRLQRHIGGRSFFRQAFLHSKDRGGYARVFGKDANGEADNRRQFIIAPLKVACDGEPAYAGMTTEKAHSIGERIPVGRLNGQPFYLDVIKASEAVIDTNGSTPLNHLTTAPAFMRFALVACGCGYPPEPGFVTKFSHVAVGTMEQT